MCDNISLEIKMEPPDETHSKEGLETHPKIQYCIEMDAKTILTLCKSEDRESEISSKSTIGDGAPPPSRSELPSKKLSDEQLHPPTPSVHLVNKEQALGPELEKFCFEHPIAVVRKLAFVLNLNSGLFSTKTLVKTIPNQIVEVEAHMVQPSDKNRHPVTGEKVWMYNSHRSYSTIEKYADYQASSFLQKILEEKCQAFGGMSGCASNPAIDILKRRLLGSKPPSNAKLTKDLIKQQNLLQFGSNVDLSDGSKWGAQLQELRKLPSFARVESTANMLLHLGHLISGLNTVQLYMKVLGSRIPGHQEHNFCSININIGPGDCEWFAVPEAYWGAVCDLCEKNEINYLHDSWWPDLEDLYKANIPVYRFFQRAGDMVWVNSGCIYWVQSAGCCNNIAWNIGPLTAHQYQQGMERYEWNKLHNCKSIVPMVNLSWNLARNISVMDSKLFHLIKNSLMQTLRQCWLIREFVKDKGVEVTFYGRDKNETSYYCEQCKIEVFNILFIKKEDERHVVNCLVCARRQSPDLQGFICSEKYKMEELMQVYDNFRLNSTV